MPRVGDGWLFLQRLPRYQSKNLLQPKESGVFMTSIIKLHFLVYYWYGFFVLVGLIAFYFADYKQQLSSVRFFNNIRHKNNLWAEHKLSANTT